MDRALPAGTVTLMFTDIEGSTRLVDALGDEYGAMLAEHHRLLREVWARRGGVEVNTEGDAFFVAFVDPAEAAAAAIDAQRCLADHDWPQGHALRVRMAVHTGTPQIHDGDYWGADVHYAARLASAAHGGQVLVSDTTRPLLREQPLVSLGEHALKDFLAPREIFQLVVDGAGAEAFPPVRTLDRVRTNLPSPSGDLLGRESELAELVEWSAEHRLVTVVGPGGSGKTRLAVELGHRIAERFEQAWFVSLEDVAHPDEVIGAVSRTLGLPGVADVPEIDRLIEYVRARSVLILLDNVEQVLDAAPLIGRVAASGDAVRVVATSQAPLRVSGERVLRLAPLPVPTASERDTTVLAAVPSVALLLRRSEAAGSALALSEENAGDVAGLCRQLEGMPLALELAAARLSLLEPADLSRRLERELDALGRGGRDLPDRQRGLRAMLEWTTSLLADDDRRLLARLSVFSGGFTPGLAETAFGEVLEGLMTLLDVGLVRREAGGRLTLRPPVRRFAAELLASGADEHASHGAVADALAEIGEKYERRWFIRAGEGRLELSPEAANVAALLDWTREHDAPRHARLAAATGWWMTHSARAEFGRTHLRVALERTGEPTLRARCLQALGTLGLASIDPSASVEAADAWRALGDVDGEVFSLLYAANLHGHRGEGERAMALVERAAEVVATAPADDDRAWALDIVTADALDLTGRQPEAEALLRPLLARAQPGSWKQFWAATKTADLAMHSGRPAEALELYGVAMQVLQPLSSPMGEVIQADTIAAALLRLGRIDDAARTLAICELVHAELGWPPPPGGVVASCLDEVRNALDDQQVRAARDRARELGVTRGLAWVGAVARGEQPAAA